MKLDEITLFFNKISSKKNKKLDSKLKFEFDDGKTYKVQREPIIKDPERLNAQISYFKGEKKINIINKI